VYSKYESTYLDTDYVAYVTKRNKVKNMITFTKVQHDKTLIQNLSSNPKALYGYVKNGSKVKISISQLEKPDGSLLTMTMK